MKALLFDKSIKMAELPEPAAKTGEALVRVSMAGICRTDIEIVKGYMGFTGVPGHEFVGVVEEAVDNSLIGRRVVGEINIWCGKCEFCAAGMQRHCGGREVLGIVGRNGAFAEKLCLPVENLRMLPDSLPDEKAVFAEPVAACFEIFEQGGLPDGETALVVGDGKLAALMAMTIEYRGHRVVVAGRHERKMKIIRDACRAETATAESLAGRRFGTVIECSGRQSGLEFATSAVRPRGKIYLKSTYADQANFNMAIWVINEITIVGSRCGLFGPAIKALSEGGIDPTSLIEKVYPFEEGERAFEHAARAEYGKILLSF